MLRGEAGTQRHAAPAERSHAFTAIFAELRHSAAAVRATRELTALEDYERAYSVASAAWAETRERTAEELGALHAAQNDRLLVRRSVDAPKWHEVHATCLCVARRNSRAPPKKQSAPTKPSLH